MTPEEIRRSLEAGANEYVSSEWDRFQHEFKVLRELTA